ncbi:MAG TPA: hypothetical protein VMD05_10130 [Candidatus Nanoarchaeia archaeon]|nr:hypothetical protein [Candidatus Nanoarchaeia archaeon]
MEEIILPNQEKRKRLRLIRTSKTVLTYRLQYLNSNLSLVTQSVEVKKLNVRDISHHLKRGESVLITPKTVESPQRQAKNLLQAPWYFDHL